MNTLRLAVVFGLGLAASAFAQTASLKADLAKLSSAGGQLVLSAEVTYDGEPGAIGWSIALPADWKLVSVSGPDVPAITPGAGATGDLEFAYTSIPTGRAAFSVVVTYPAGTASGAAVPTVLIRQNGKLTTLHPASIQFGGLGQG